jgi:hypothetical protein
LGQPGGGAELGQTKIDNLDSGAVATAADDHIGGFQVPEDDSTLVGGLQAVGKLAGNIQSIA